MKLIAKRVGIPNSLSNEVINNFEFMISDEYSNAHDIYLGLHEVLFSMKVQNAGEANICRMEDSLARILSLNFKQYDLA